MAAQKAYQHRLTDPYPTAYTEGELFCEEIGLIAEFAFGYLFGVLPDLRVHETNDGGVDFELNHVTFNVKTSLSSRDNMSLIRRVTSRGEVKELVSQCYTGGYFHEHDTHRVQYMFQKTEDGPYLVRKDYCNIVLLGFVKREDLEDGRPPQPKRGISRPGKWWNIEAYYADMTSIEHLFPSQNKYTHYLRDHGILL